jgi:ABC-type ATPase with predicted acetyltransferase domain
MKNYILLFVLFMAVQNLQAQDAQTEITDAELEKYAVTMDSINDMKESLLEDIAEMVKNNEKMTNARYNELSKISEDEAALAKAKATPEEIAFLKEVAAKKDEGTAKIQETFQSMAKEYVGASSYNKIKKALSSDTEVKKRYETFMDKLEANDSGVN